ncbi:MAG: MoxR family ATPase [Dehalococcoidales bacterium]|nr:MoxR family ATPase [Dehalococcoidales bacterium]MDP6632758.1 MoxR family ATPase [Dehalococcoidales bacterium]
MSGDTFDRFMGSNDYVTSEPLRNAVNVAIVLGRPLLIRGEPGTGKTLLAHSIAGALEKQLLIWNVKSTTKAQEGLYLYDTVQRLNDSRFGGKDVSDIKHYIKLGKLGQAFSSAEQMVILIDEVDKADIEFPNDLLNELDEMSFYIPETNETIVAIHRPITIITSNAEKELPDAFLRRCIFHYIEFPSPDLMEKIVLVHFPDIQNNLVQEAMKVFYSLREIDEFRKKPTTSELIDWMKALLAGGVPVDSISQQIPFVSALLKKETDYEFFTKNYLTGLAGDYTLRKS